VVPDEKRGRVMSITQAGSMAAMPLAYGLTGFLIETVGFLFVLCGVGVGVLCCTLLTRDIQKIEETGSVD
jgi:predicted MFS family arabinose efflux permease